MPHPRPAVQERSRETLERILEAAAAAVSERGFDAVSLREICDSSGVSTGAFYARFRHKEDLALPLLDSLRGELQATIETHLAHRRKAGLRAAFPSLLHATIDLYRRRGGLLRALIAQAWTSRELAEAMRDLNDTTFRQLLAPPHDEAIRHPRLEVALPLAWLSVLNALKELVLDRHLLHQPPTIDDDLLVEELSTLFWCYLTHDPG